MKTMSERDNGQIELMKEMTNWLRLMGMKQLTETVNSILSKDEEKIVYQNSDGEKTTRQIEGLTGMSIKNVSMLWKKCFLGGLGEYKSASGGHIFKRTFDLESLGMISGQKTKSEANSKNKENDTISEEKESGQ